MSDAFGSSSKSLSKKEGDGKSPAGLFSIGPVFGDEAHRSYAKKMPFVLVADDLECVDDPSSQYYNRFVNADSIPNPDWKSSEKMKEIGSLYALGIVVQHNLHPIQPEMGSAIFIHKFGKDVGTAGCTAMQEEDLNEVVLWLDAQKYPCLIQLPLEEYRSSRAQMELPELPSEQLH